MACSVRADGRKRDAPGSACEAVHKAFRTTVSRGGVAPLCYALRPPAPCGDLCDELTATVAVYAGSGQ